VTGRSQSRVLYIGITSDLTARYELCKLVYAEAFTYVRDAIARESNSRDGDENARLLSSRP